MEENKEIKKKTKFVSTIILFIILAISIVAFIAIMMFDFKEVMANTEKSQDSVAGAVAVGFVAVIILVLMIAIAIGLVIVDLIALLKSINNRKSEVKWIKITSFILDGLFAFMIIGTIIRFITWIA